MAKSEPKGSLVTIPVTIKGNQMLTYVMRMGETMPIFNFWPRGREVIQRLILRAATTDNISDLNIYRTEETTLKTIIFQRLEKEKEEELNCYNSSARDRF